MWFTVVLTGVSTFYIHAENDYDAMLQARTIAKETRKELRMVFVSAHNDPIEGPSRMREVYRVD